MLETAAHLNPVGLPLNWFLVAIDIPAIYGGNAVKCWSALLPVGWSTIPAGLASVQIGAEWSTANASATLCVPSVIAPEELVALINLAHPQAHRITASMHRPVI